RVAAEVAEVDAGSGEHLDVPFAPDVDIAGGLVHRHSPVGSEAVFADVVRRRVRLADFKGAPTVQLGDLGGGRSATERGAPFDDRHFRGVLGGRAPEKEVWGEGPDAAGAAF